MVLCALVPDACGPLTSVVKLLGLGRAAALAAEDDPARGTGTTVVEPVDRTLGGLVVAR